MRPLCRKLLQKHTFDIHPQYMPCQQRKQYSKRRSFTMNSLKTAFADDQTMIVNQHKPTHSFQLATFIRSFIALNCILFNRDGVVWRFERNKTVLLAELGEHQLREKRSFGRHRRRRMLQLRLEQAQRRSRQSHHTCAQCNNVGTSQRRLSSTPVCHANSITGETQWLLLLHLSKPIQRCATMLRVVSYARD